MQSLRWWFPNGLFLAEESDGETEGVAISDGGHAEDALQELPLLRPDQPVWIQ